MLNAPTLLTPTARNPYLRLAPTTGAYLQVYPLNATAALIRLALDAAVQLDAPTHRYRVTSQRRASGDVVLVRWQGGPNEAAVAAVVNAYATPTADSTPTLLDGYASVFAARAIRLQRTPAPTTPSRRLVTVASRRKRPQRRAMGA